MSTVATFNALVDDRIEDSEGVLSSTQIDSAVAAAVKTYSRHRPYERVDDLDGDGGYDYALPADWRPQASVVRRVEYPAGNREPTRLEDDQYTLYKSDSTTTVLRLLDVTPQTGETIRLTPTKSASGISPPRWPASGSPVTTASRATPASAPIPPITPARLPTTPCAPNAFAPSPSNTWALPRKPRATASPPRRSPRPARCATGIRI